MTLPSDYLEQVYAGVLGKIIGVYLGRPFEQWSHERIVRELGEIWFYVHHKLNVPLIVSDDDITGTFTFVRSMADHGFDRQLTPAQIGHSWLNYIIENKTILWWGGMGMSTEHTAFIRLKRGMEAPLSGSIATNGATVAEQIGAQIFIDGWGMIAAGDPAMAADLAKRAASVSHDGEAVYAAQVIASIEAAAFVESDLDKLLDIGVSFIPKTSIIAQLIADLRTLRKTSDDWHVGLARIHEKYSYAIYNSNCHVIPNHAVVMLGLLWGDGDFDRSLMITNTAGYDTDCNSGNVGCVLGIRNGLKALSRKQDWRGPVADRLLLPTADGGSSINDALSVATSIANTGRRLHGLPPVSPKNGSRFHFSMLGSVQGFTRDPKTPAATSVGNTQNVLAFHFNRIPPELTARASTPTFMSEEQLKMPGYAVVAAPTLYSGQVMRARLRSRSAGINARLVLQHFNTEDQLILIHSQTRSLSQDWTEFVWICPDTGGLPIANIGVEVIGPAPQGTIELDSLHWSGSPTVVLKRLATGKMWKRAWVDAVSSFLTWRHTTKNTIIQNDGRGLLITGTREWIDYRVSATVTPNMVQGFGLAVRVQGLGRYCALIIGNDRKARLVEVLHSQRVLAEAPFDWQFDTSDVNISIQVVGQNVTATINDGVILRGQINPLLDGGGIAVVVDEGTLSFGSVSISPP